MGLRKHWLKQLTVYGDRKRAVRFLSRLEGKKPLFVLTIATTKTATVPGITVAGAQPNLVKFTPAADAELIYYGRCKSIKAVPATPDGKPTPALITLTALRIAEVPILVVDAGAEVKPQLAYITLHAQPGGDIRNGFALDRASVQKILGYAKALGEQLAKMADYVILGESIPGGTTTALGMLTALGIDAQDKISSSMPENPRRLKSEVVRQGLNAAGLRPGQLSGDPIEAVSKMGDPMIPSVSGLAMGAGRRKPVFLAGGTQMGAILATIESLSSNVLPNLMIVTTSYITKDNQSDLDGLIQQIAKIPIIAVDIGLSRSSKPGLRAYSEGFVKEGVGAGGASLAAILRKGSMLTDQGLLQEIEKTYEKVIEGKPA